MSEKEIGFYEGQIKSITKQIGENQTAINNLLLIKKAFKSAIKNLIKNK